MDSTRIKQSFKQKCLSVLPISNKISEFVTTIPKNFNTNMQMYQHMFTLKVTSCCKGKPRCNWLELKFANSHPLIPKDRTVKRNSSRPSHEMLFSRDEIKHHRNRSEWEFVKTPFKTSVRLSWTVQCYVKANLFSLHESKCFYKYIYI